jgi:hypothetical protein
MTLDNSRRAKGDIAMSASRFRFFLFAELFAFAFRS